PGAEAQKIPSLKAFYSFDSLSLFDSVGQQRLIREWSGEKFIRSEWLNYDDRGLPVVRPHSLWERWFVSGENEGEAKIFQQFLDWRDEVRRVPVQVKPLADAAYEIRGSDILRTPVNPSYALAFALTPTSQNQAPLLVQE